MNPSKPSIENGLPAPIATTIILACREELVVVIEKFPALPEILSTFSFSICSICGFDFD
jgi:hypothetical protein